MRPFQTLWRHRVLGAILRVVLTDLPLLTVTPSYFAYLRILVPCPPGNADGLSDFQPCSSRRLWRLERKLFLPEANRLTPKILYDNRNIPVTASDKQATGGYLLKSTYGIPRCSPETVTQLSAAFRRERLAAVRPNDSVVIDCMGRRGLHLFDLIHECV
jgi:hypothetical protein